MVQFDTGTVEQLYSDTDKVWYWYTLIMVQFDTGTVEQWYSDTDKSVVLVHCDNGTVWHGYSAVVV